MTIPGKSIFCNKFVKTFYAIESFRYYGLFQLTHILSFQKRYTCLKKILGTSELFKKMWSQVLLFSANFDFGAQLSHEIFKTSHPNFRHVIYKQYPFQNAIYIASKSINKWLRYHQKKVEKR